MVILIILLVIGAFIWASYNSLVSYKNIVQDAWSNIDVQLKRRYDLIPNLVETVKGYAEHEQETLNQVINARNSAIESKDMKSQIQAESSLAMGIKGIFALAEAYPELKANESFHQMQRDLGEIEDAIQNARRYYNAVVRDYNTKCEQFPSCVVANIFHFKKNEFFEASAEEKENVKVNFSKK